MESANENGSFSVDFRTGVTSKLGEGENFSQRKEVLESSSSPSTSQTNFHFVPNTTPHHNGATSSPTHDQTKTYSTSEFHDTSEKGYGSKISSPIHPFGEPHNSQVEDNNSAFSSQNPFLLPSEKLHQEDGVSIENRFFSTHDDDDSFSGEMLSKHSSPWGNNNNPFEVQTTSNNTLNGASFSHNFDDVDNENHDHRHESSLSHHNHEQVDWRIFPNNTPGDESHVFSSSQHLDPFFTLEEEESTQNQKLTNASDKTHETAIYSTNIDPNHTFSVDEQKHHSLASTNLGTDSDKNLGSSDSSFPPAAKSSTLDPIHNSTNEPSKLEKNNSNLDLESSDDSDDDIPISSMQNHGSETQNPPVQVMERPGDNPSTTTTTATSTSSSNYRIPSRVFARSKSKTEWSTASNESLFSIQMGNMSFSREFPWYYKSGELDNNYNNKSTIRGSELHMSGPLASNNQHPLPPQPRPQPQPRQQTQVNKFSDMNQRSAEQHEGWGTEEKASETMREVIMEETLRKKSLSNEAPPLYIRHCDSNDFSNHSNGSTKSFAFKISTDGDRTLSAKYVEELRKQQKQTELQTIMKETPNAAQTAKSTTNNNNNVPQNRWLSCFSCCNN